MISRLNRLTFHSHENKTQNLTNRFKCPIDIQNRWKRFMNIDNYTRSYLYAVIFGAYVTYGWNIVMEQTDAILRRIREMLVPLGFEIYPFKVMQNCNTVFGKMSGLNYFQTNTLAGTTNIVLFTYIIIILLNYLTKESSLLFFRTFLD